MAEPLEEVSIVSLDAHGHGIAANGAIVPGALPGERTLVKFEGKRAELVETLNPSPQRATPICPWFGTCGGCVAQHMSASLYRRWKRSSVVEALEREGVGAEVCDLVDAHGAGRRRATLHARFPHGQPDELGFMRARSHDVIAIDACPLFSPGMAGAIPAAHALSGDLRGLMKPLDIGVTVTLDGLDVDLRGSGPLGRAEMQKLTQTADALNLARVSNHGEIVIERRAPRVAFDGALARLPPGSFLQATEAGEVWLADFAERALASAKMVADLFCGAGAFALRLARGREVFAADADHAAVTALARAAATTPGLCKLGTATRDLFRRPLRADELAAFDAALIDPPRAGALEQARALAASTLPLVVSISNAASLARDARILIDGGFQIESVTPLDQFRFSAHVEIAAIFRRPRQKARTRRLL
jgi:23S rRNA (uracil1939-C5)-methyltransferase